MAVIDVGPAAILRPAEGGGSSTLIALENPANDTGKLTQIEIYALPDHTLTAVTAGTFSGSAPNFTSRDSAALGNITGGSKQTISGLSIDVVTGDLLGWYYASALERIERTEAGGSGVHYKLGDQFEAGQQAYELLANVTYSVYGEGHSIYEDSCTDGISIGDTPASQQIFEVSVTDGVQPGDSTSSIGAFGVGVSDGAKFGDTPLGGLILEMSLTDGVILSEALAQALTIDLSLSDGAGLGDTPLSQATFNPTLSDGVKLSDTPLATGIFGMSVADGVKLSEALATIGVFGASLTEGAKIGDVPLANLIFQVALTDGVKVGDLSVMEVLARLLKLITYTRPHSNLKTYARKYSDLRVYTSEVEIK